MKQRVLLKGKDALDLLHRLSTLDFKHLNLHEKTVGLILNPQGKIRSYFEVVLISDEAAEVEFADDFLSILDQYTFSEKYEAKALDVAQAGESSERDRILSLTPKWGSEFLSNEETNPLEINLRSSVHDDKGCYPGQEVIEKIISLGSPAKKLCLVEGVLNSPTLPSAVTDLHGTAAGILTSYSDGFGLAILKRNFLRENESLLSGLQKLIVRKISE